MTSTSRTLTPRFLPGETARLVAVECDCFVGKIGYLLGGVFEYSIEYWFDGLLRTATVYEHDLAPIKKSTEPGTLWGTKLIHPDLCDKIAGAKQDDDVRASSILERETTRLARAASEASVSECKLCGAGFSPRVCFEKSPAGVDARRDRVALAFGHYCLDCLTKSRVDVHSFTPSKDDKRPKPLCVRCGELEAHPDHLHDYLGDRR